MGWAFKKDTNDSRESAAIYVADLLLDEMALIEIYDPKVDEDQIFQDLSNVSKLQEKQLKKCVKVNSNPYHNCENAHAIAILTEWDEFKSLDWNKIYESMNKPAFIFDGRNILDRKKIEKIGFIYNGIGKPK